MATKKKQFGTLNNSTICTSKSSVQREVKGYLILSQQVLLQHCLHHQGNDFQEEKENPAPALHRKAVWEWPESHSNHVVTFPNCWNAVWLQHPLMACDSPLLETSIQKNRRQNLWVRASMGLFFSPIWVTSMQFCISWQSLRKRKRIRQVFETKLLLFWQILLCCL